MNLRIKKAGRPDGRRRLQRDAAREARDLGPREEKEKLEVTTPPLTVLNLNRCLGSKSRLAMGNPCKAARRAGLPQLPARCAPAVVLAAGARPAGTGAQGAVSNPHHATFTPTLVLTLTLTIHPHAHPHPP